MELDYGRGEDQYGWDEGEDEPDYPDAPPVKRQRQSGGRPAPRPRQPTRQPPQRRGAPSKSVQYGGYGGRGGEVEEREEEEEQEEDQEEEEGGGLFEEKYSQPQRYRVTGRGRGRGAPRKTQQKEPTRRPRQTTAYSTPSVMEYEEGFFEDTPQARRPTRPTRPSRPAPPKVKRSGGGGRGGEEELLERIVSDLLGED